MQNYRIGIQEPTYATNHRYPVSKALIGKTPSGNAGSGCAQWIEQNQHIYQAILNGSSGLSKQDQAQFMDWYRYAYETSFGGGSAGAGWGDGVEDQGGVGGSQANGVGLPEGAKLGAQGNIVFNQEKTETTYIPSKMPIDVLSDTVVLNIEGKLRGDVTVEKTTDTRLKPATPVIKIIVKDPDSQPSETVYFVNPEAQITINTIGGKGVKISGGLEKSKLPGGDPQITVGAYSADNANGSNGTTGEASMKGVEDKNKPGTRVYKPEFEGETINFWAKPGKNETHVVYANANISCKPGDQADATLDANTGDLTIKVTHDDASTDTYVVKKGYNANLNINKEYITFNGQAPKDGKIPEAYKDRVKVPSLGVPADSTKATETQSILTALLKATGRSEAQLVSAFQATGYGAYKSIDDIQKAIGEGKFPGDITSSNFHQLLKVLDPTLKASLEEMSNAGGKNDEEKKAITEKVGKRIVDFLKIFYPNEIVDYRGFIKSQEGALTIGTRKFKWQGWGYNGDYANFRIIPD